MVSSRSREMNQKISKLTNTSFLLESTSYTAEERRGEEKRREEKRGEERRREEKRGEERRREEKRGEERRREEKRGEERRREEKRGEERRREEKRGEQIKIKRALLVKRQMKKYTQLLNAKIAQNWK